jgi:hypothetical protein
LSKFRIVSVKEEDGKQVELEAFTGYDERKRDAAWRKLVKEGVNCLKMYEIEGKKVELIAFENLKVPGLLAHEKDAAELPMEAWDPKMSHGS